MPRLIDITTVRTRDGRSIEGNRKAVSTALLKSVKKGAVAVKS